MRIEIITFFVVYIVVAFIHHDNWQQLTIHAGGLAACSSLIARVLRDCYYDYVCVKEAKNLLLTNKLTQSERLFCESVIASPNNNLSTYQHLINLSTSVGNKRNKSNILQNVMIYLTLFSLAVMVYLVLFLLLAYFYF
jgi:hypothetical protein